MPDNAPQRPRGRRPRRLYRSHRLRFVIDCTEADGLDINVMIDAAHAISRDAFKRYVVLADLTALERKLGYQVGPGGDGLHLARDWHVGYFRSTYQGKPCVYLTWSGIEHIFA